MMDVIYMKPNTIETSVKEMTYEKKMMRWIPMEFSL